MSAAAADTPAPLVSIPTSKEKKYDRQLRLWAASGQAALEDAHILLINSGPGVVGVEALKNLVLPGIGQFTIQDSALVDDADLGVNFFLDESCLGGFRAEHTTRLLEELNPDVKGHAVTEPLASWISAPDSLKPYTLILVTAPVTPDTLSLLTTYAQSHTIPLFHVHSIGFFSGFSLALPSAFPIVDTHPDPASITDLRLLNPWPELVDFTKQKTKDLRTLSSHDLGHIPYVLLLLHYLDEWRGNHEGKPPSDYKEKTEFRELVRSAGPMDEENYAEAAAAVLKSLNPPTPSSSVLEVLNAAESQSLTATTSSFWYIASAIYTFYQNHKQLPLPGALPDMKAQSADYIALQGIYKAKARADCAEVTKAVRELESRHERSQKDQIDEKEIEAFCKGAAHVKLIRGSASPVALSLKPLEWNADSAKSAVQAMGLLILGDSSILTHIALLAWDAFVASHDADATSGAPTIPGAVDSQVEADAEKLIGISETVIDAIIKAAVTFIEDPEYTEVKEGAANVCRELVRAGGAELHNIAALTGGMVAQEVIKVITKQYVPIDNTCVFDGIASKTGVLGL